MRLVVTAGTGTALAGAGGEVLAKTGTAEFGSGTPPPTHAWLIAYRGDLAVAVRGRAWALGRLGGGPDRRALLRSPRHRGAVVNRPSECRQHRSSPLQEGLSQARAGVEVLRSVCAADAARR
jgi:hypothetical protein